MHPDDPESYASGSLFLCFLGKSIYDYLLTTARLFFCVQYIIRYLSAIFSSSLLRGIAKEAEDCIHPDCRG
jgi:hypothetical protein